MVYNKSSALNFLLLACVAFLCGCGFFMINPLDPSGDKALNEYIANRQAVLERLEKYKQANQEKVRNDFGEPAQIQRTRLFRGVSCEEVWEYEFPVKRASPFTCTEGFIWFCFEKGYVVFSDVM